jgi:hypothetical protein
MSANKTDAGERLAKSIAHCLIFIERAGAANTVTY